MNSRVVAVVIGGMMAPHALADGGSMQDFEQIVQCLADLAPRVVDEEYWISRLEEKGWPSVRVFFEFERSICTAEDIAHDQDIRLERAKEMLTNLRYRSPLLERLREESQGEGIPSACGDKLFTLKNDPQRFQERFAPFARKLEPLVYEEAAAHATDLSRKLTNMKRWSSVKLAAAIIESHPRGYRLDRERSMPQFRLYCTDFTPDFDACLAFEPATLRRDSTPEAAITLAVVPKDKTSINRSDLFPFDLKTLWGSLDTRYYTYFRSPQGLERAVRFALDAYDIVLDEIRHCFGASQ